jgi:hypothetical protein
MNTINIGTPIDLQKLIDTRLLIQAGSGGGKSYLLRKLAESASGHVQQLILDPEGEFITLREKFDFALVAKEGDIPLSLKYAEMLAHKLLETNLSAIIDLYELKHHERIFFVKRFLDALVNAPKELWHPALIYVDEAHIFCPESTKSESAGAVIDLCTRGRKRGFSAILATQRLSKLHKDAAAECLNKMIGRTGLDIDRKRAGEELGMIGKQEIINLRELAPGEFFSFGPAMTNEVKKFKVSTVVTTHLKSGSRQAVKPPTPNAIKKILNKLSSIPEEAEKELQTKQQLQQEVTRLRTELTKASKSATPIVDQSQINILKKQVQEKDNEILSLNKAVLTIEKRNTDIREALQKIIDRITGSPKAPEKIFTKQEISIPKKEIYIPRPKNNSVGSLPIGELKILTACAQFPNGLKRDQLTVLTGYKRSSRDAYIQRLKEKELLIQENERLFPTQMGIDTLGNDFQPLPTGEELQQYWLSNLPPGEKAILEELISAYPESVSRDILSEKTGYMRSSRDAYIQRMAAKELVIAVGRGEVKASENLFD